MSSVDDAEVSVACDGDDLAVDWTEGSDKPETVDLTVVEKSESSVMYEATEPQAVAPADDWHSASSADGP